ncbi:MAG: YdeI/OmpD-associated family protein [Bacteroidota bacterium]
MSELKDGIKTYHAKDATSWRKWLKINHLKEKNVWLIIYKKIAETPSVTYPEAVDEALCFGWIDSKPNKRDDKSFYQYFSKRNPKSNWSKVNKEKIKRLQTEGKIAPAGKEMIRLAKETGTWDALDDVENLVLPQDLQKEFHNNKLAFDNFQQFPRSVKRGILEWIFNAKRANTRTKRIQETVKLAEKNIRANQYKK